MSKGSPEYRDNHGARFITNGGYSDPSAAKFGRDSNWIGCPQPGNYLALKGQTYAVLERHHQYQYKIGGYCLRKISLYVQTAPTPNEKSLIEGRWVMGDASCRFNAKSELLRCAINPPILSRLSFLRNY
ncbi:MAG UNVERIFIED_CONTAM: DUF6464 family protein [Microcystis novacekii LVE1205-3]